MTQALIGTYYKSKPKLKKGEVSIEYQNGYLVVSKSQARDCGYKI